MAAFDEDVEKVGVGLEAGVFDAADELLEFEAFGFGVQGDAGAFDGGDKPAMDTNSSTTVSLLPSVSVRSRWATCAPKPWRRSKPSVSIRG